MEVLDAIDSQCFCQSFVDKSVSWDKVTILLNSSLHAPRAGNLHHLKFVLLLNQKEKQQLAEAAHDQLYIAQAPLCIVVCSDKENLKRYYPKNCDYYSVQDSAVAVQNLFLTAVSMGMGTHWVRTFDEEKVRYQLKLPDHVKPESMVAVGYTDQPSTEKRVPQLDSCVYFHEYGNKKRDAGLFPFVNDENIEKVKNESTGFLKKVKNIFKKEKETNAKPH
jgi:nitroreductase